VNFGLAPGTILVFDRGYVDYQWYQRLTDGGVFFVTRLRHDAHYRVLEQCPVRKIATSSKMKSSPWGSPPTGKWRGLRRVEVGLRNVRKSWCC